MCMIGDSGTVELLSDATPIARKPHQCGECRRTIQPGERYERHTALWEGELETYKTCVQCVAVREWLSRVCGGWIYGSVGEDLTEHFRDGYGLWLGRAAVGVNRKWRTSMGKLMPPMKLPEKLPVGY